MSTVTTGTANRGPQFRLRWSPIDGAELRCQHCGEWWSIGEDARDYWVIGKNWSRCRVCVREANRLWHAKRAAEDEDFRKRGWARSTKYRKWLVKHHPDLVRALKREQAARKRERDRAKRQAAAA